MKLANRHLEQLRVLTLDEEIPQCMEHRQDDHCEQLQKSKDVRFGPHIVGALGVVWPGLVTLRYLCLSRVCGGWRLSRCETSMARSLDSSTTSMKVRNASFDKSRPPSHAHDYLD
jgi:hypothetical protein